MNFSINHVMYFNASKIFVFCAISGFLRDVDETYGVLGYYAALSGSSVPMFRDTLSVPSSRVKKSESFRNILNILSEFCVDC
jgi:hypothetical protein